MKYLILSFVILRLIFISNTCLGEVQQGKLIVQSNVSSEFNFIIESISTYPRDNQDDQLIQKSLLDLEPILKKLSHKERLFLIKNFFYKKLLQSAPSEATSSSSLPLQISFKQVGQALKKLKNNSYSFKLHQWLKESISADFSMLTKNKNYQKLVDKLASKKVLESKDERELFNKIKQVYPWLIFLADNSEDILSTHLRSFCYEFITELKAYLELFVNLQERNKLGDTLNEKVMNSASKTSNFFQFSNQKHKVYNDNQNEQDKKVNTIIDSEVKELKKSKDKRPADKLTNKNLETINKKEVPLVDQNKPGKADKQVDIKSSNKIKNEQWSPRPGRPIDYPILDESYVPPEKLPEPVQDWSSF